MSAIETAKQHWGDKLPDWIEVLAMESDKSSQNKIAQKNRQIIGRNQPGS